MVLLLPKKTYSCSTTFKTAKNRGKFGTNIQEFFIQHCGSLIYLVEGRDVKRKIVRNLKDVIFLITSSIFFMTTPLNLSICNIQLVLFYEFNSNSSLHLFCTLVNENFDLMTGKIIKFLSRYQKKYMN